MPVGREGNLGGQTHKPVGSLCFHCFSHSVVSDSATPWTVNLSTGFPGKNTGVSYCFPTSFSRGIFQTQGSNLSLLHRQVDSLLLSHQAQN